MQKKDEQNLWYVLHDINLLKHKKVLYRNQKIGREKKIGERVAWQS